MLSLTSVFWASHQAEAQRRVAKPKLDVAPDKKSRTCFDHVLQNLSIDAWTHGSVMIVPATSTLDHHQECPIRLGKFSRMRNYEISKTATPGPGADSVLVDRHVT